ncbi:hypothetical protein ACFO3J_19480 [Streptomyces polygonati]|uniref:Uncharacterized protein n=1 Tax=Streptomyces polygonati TaxID=1617087 RepID=A0ABV8HNS1_9ACTN
MHSSGRGEESPEAYRGVGHPPGQNQPLTYGEQIQPAGGSPWGSPGPGAGSLPEPADATQMLPPYPAGMPAPGSGPGSAQAGADGQDGGHGTGHGNGHGNGHGGPGSPAQVPIADATQMLPPYPGDDPSVARHGGGSVPPLPPIPPHTPAQAQHSGHQPQHAQPPVAPAEATQAMPLSLFQDDQPYEQRSFDDQQYGGQAPQQGYEQASYDQQQSYDGGYEQQQYGQQDPQQGQQSQPGQPQYGGGQEYGSPEYGGQEYGGGYEDPSSGPTPSPQHDSDYDHLFRTDVPSPPPIRQRIVGSPGQQQAGQPGQQPYGQGAPGGPGQQPPYGQQAGPYEPAYGYDEGDGGQGGGRRMSPKVLIGIAVAVLVVGGIVVGGMLGGGSGGDSSPTATGNTASTGPSSSTSASGPAAGGADDDAVKQQAQALDALLKTSGNSRSAVVGAVASVRECKALSQSAADLRQAATQRAGLVTQLRTLAVDKLPDHAELTAALTQAWQASAAADGHYAKWADEADSQHKVCKGGHAQNTSETNAGDRASSTATTQKKHAVKLWNSIAEKYGLTQRTYSQL